MIFETDRLAARLWRAEDLDEMFAIYGNPNVMRFLGGFTKQIETREEMQARLERRLEAQKSWAPGKGAWALVRKADEKLVGCILCLDIPDGEGTPTGEVEIGWHLGEEFWGRGYASEAAAGVVDHAFAKNPDLDHLIAVLYGDNVASRKVAERLGMTHRGQSDKYYGVTLEVFELRRT